MSGYRPTVADIEAAMMVFQDVSDLSDSLSAEDALDYRLAIERVRKAGADTISDLDTQLKKVLEGQMVRHGRRYWVGRKKESVRFDHGKIAGTVVRMASQPDEDGVFPEGVVAARTAVDLMSKLYISDSTGAKIGALNSLGLNTDRDNLGSVRTYEKGERIVTFMDAPGVADS